MRMFLISDNVDTLTGMRLAGIQGVVVHKENELKEALETVFSQKDINIVLITEKLYYLNPSYINRLKLEMKLPLFTVIPDRHGSSRQENYIKDYIKESVGLKY